MIQRYARSVKVLHFKVHVLGFSAQRNCIVHFIRESCDKAALWYFKVIVIRSAGWISRIYIVNKCGNVISARIYVILSTSQLVLYDVSWNPLQYALLNIVTCKIRYHNLYLWFISHFVVLQFSFVSISSAEGLSRIKLYYTVLIIFLNI